MAAKLQSMRILEAQGVAYTALTFSPDVHSAEGVAEVVGAPVEQVYKTLVVERADGGKPLLVMLAGNRELDLKKLAAAVGAKRLQMAAHKDAERLTGLKVGGISALALMHKRWPVYLDRPALDYEWILVSAGQRGVNLRVPVADLIRVTGAEVVDASRAP
ncbi:MAG: aminoacyl-tRNA deacylase [Anaerolineae bacterium]|nr:aminoacyl-tRNA deacylase [Anaerolineae bacterium]